MSAHRLVQAGISIGGQWRGAASGATMNVVAPATGDVLGTVPRCGGPDVECAVAAARVAARGWSGLPPADRERHLLRAADRIEEVGLTRLLDLVIDESGSTIQKARSEVAYASSLFRAAAGESRRLYGDTFPNDDPACVSVVLREPLGVVAVVSPFNAPVALVAKMIAFPLAAGNAVVLKPSELTPLCALQLARILEEAGLPAGVLNAITGTGAQTGRHLVGHAGIDGIAFTGSTATGLEIARAAASRACRVQLELGGKSPLLVLADADPACAARIAARGAFVHAGQICMANSRVVVEEPLLDAVCDALVREAEGLRLGDLRDEATAYGPLIDARALAKVQGHVDEAVAACATVLTGGAVHEGLVYRPTVVRDPPRQCALWREETFGPVVSVVGAADLEGAIAAANDSDYGLSAGIVTNDLRRGLTAARALRCGAVHIGSHAFVSNALAPIGGRGVSGIGRSGGKYSTQEFTELKWISMRASL